MAVLLADGLAGLEALAEALLEDADDGSEPPSLRGDAPEVAESHDFLREQTIARTFRRVSMVAYSAAPLSSAQKELDHVLAAPFVSSVMDIEKDWIDYNGHLNMAYYNVHFRPRLG